MRVVSETLFSKHFHSENYSVFIPRKDQCDVCVSYKHHNIRQAEYEAHIHAKDQARAEKDKDKASTTDKKSVWTMDLQAVLLCPQTKASAMYYKTKLQVHNFTMYNLATKEGYCYVWTETEGSLASESFGYLQYQHFERIISQNPSIEEIIVWSDGCGYQNRNTVVANGYSELSRKYGVVFKQKFLVAGHTQMECDSMHSKIESQIVTDVFTPRDYIVMMLGARRNPDQYTMQQVYHTEWMKLDGCYFNSIRPGKKKGDPTVHDLRALEYHSSGELNYKLTFAENAQWEDLPHRVHVPAGPLQWVRMFQVPLPLTNRKYNDLQSMLHVMPPECRHFYETLPPFIDFYTFVFLLAILSCWEFN